MSFELDFAFFVTPPSRRFLDRPEGGVTKLKIQKYSNRQDS
ncbi:hypothetical protein [Kamptonema sp. UHCC 0994]|nr:hypothetical protein [Kamptonema sp. UHCC 0994]MDF0551618.1 hypothetical protein [Kamptonema sp. UHCC 0994]